MTEDEIEDERLVSQVKANWSARRAIQRWRVEPGLLADELDETGKPIETARMRFVAARSTSIR